MTLGSAAPHTQFLSGSTRAKVAVGLLVAVIISDLLGIFGGLGQLGLLARVAADGGVSTAEGEASDARMAMIGVFQMVAFWSCAIAFLSWLHRANRTTRSFGTAYMEFTPAWAVGWWFVPFANLIRPFQAVSEVWKTSSPRSTDATSWQAESTPPLLYAWWTFWLLGNFVANAYLRLSIRSWNEPTMDDLLMMTRVGIGSDVLSIVAGILAILVVVGINERQERKRILLQSAGAQGGQPAGYPGGFQPAYGAGGYPQPAGPGGYTPAAPSADPVAHYNRGV